MLLNYLYQNFLEEDDFLTASGLEKRQLQSLQRRRILPLPSYVYSANGRSTSFPGSYCDEDEYRFHQKGHVHWADTVSTLGIEDEDSAQRHFEHRFNSAKDMFLTSTLGLALCSKAPEIQESFDEANLKLTWSHFLDGTYGLCTKDGLPETIFLKGAGVRFIESLINDTGFGGNDDDHNLLRQIVDLLDRVESDFAPHEIRTSSRQRCINNVRKKYLS